MLIRALGDEEVSANLREFEAMLDDAAASAPATLPEALQRLTELQALSTRVHHDYGMRAGEAAEWSRALLQYCSAAQAELRTFGFGPAPTVADVLVTTVPAAPGIPRLSDIAGWLKGEPPLELRGTAWLEAAQLAQARIEELQRLAHIAGQCAQMDFRFLYDSERQLLRMG